LTLRQKFNFDGSGISSAVTIHGPMTPYVSLRPAQRHAVGCTAVGARHLERQAELARMPARLKHFGNIAGTADELAGVRHRRLQQNAAHRNGLRGARQLEHLRAQLLEVRDEQIAGRKRPTHAAQFFGDLRHIADHIALDELDLNGSVGACLLAADLHVRWNSRDAKARLTDPVELKRNGDRRPSQRVRPFASTSDPLASDHRERFHRQTQLELVVEATAEMPSKNLTCMA
jgi:hypothetical protein